MPQTIKSFSEATPFDARVLNDNYDDTTKPKIRTASMASTRGSQSDGSDTDTETITAPSTPPTCKAQVEALPPTPLPKMQLFIVLLIQFAEPVTATVIYPFVNQFVRETGVTGGDERRVGYYAGAVVSFSHVGMCHCNVFLSPQRQRQRQKMNLRIELIFRWERPGSTTPHDRLALRTKYLLSALNTDP